MLHVLVNPKAGNGKALRVWRRIAPLLDRSGLMHEVRIASFPGDIAETCRRMAGLRAAAEAESEREQDVIVIIGGDGTIHEAVNGLTDSEGEAAADGPRSPLPALAYIPAGSGNDYARGHGIPLDPERAFAAAIAAVRQGRFKRIDVLQTGRRTAASSFGAGLDGAVAYAANRSPAKRLLGRIGLGSVAYVLTLVRVLASYRPSDALLEVDGERHALRRVWLAAISNIDSYGGGMRINPSAKPDDGLVDVCIVSGLSRLGLLFAFPRVYNGNHAAHPGVSFYRGRNVKLDAAAPLRIHADGEDAGTTPIGIGVRSRALVIVDQRET